MKFDTPKPLPYNQITNLQLYCGKDGILRVKNGLTLDEYLNHPKFKKRRKEKIKNSRAKELKFVMVDEQWWSVISMPHSA